MKLIQHKMPQREGQALVVAPIGDIQYTGRPDAVSSKLTAHLQRCQAMDAYYIGLGDYIDFMSPSNRQRLSNADLYDNAKEVIEDTAGRLVEKVYETYLRPTVGRWLGMVSGHHYTQFADGTTSDDMLADMLGAPLTEALMYIRLFFSGPGGRKGHTDLWVHHGNGGASLQAVLTKLEKHVPHWPASFFLMGHATKRGAKVLPRMDPVFSQYDATLKDREVWLVSCGGWSRAYQDTRTDYVEKGMMTPTALGAPLLTIIPRWEGRRFTPELRVEV